MGYPNLRWPQLRKAVFQSVICDRMFWKIYLIDLAKKLSNYVRNYDNVGELSKEADHDSGNIFE